MGRASKDCEKGSARSGCRADRRDEDQSALVACAGRVSSYDRSASATARSTEAGGKSAAAQGDGAGRQGPARELAALWLRSGDLRLRRTAVNRSRACRAGPTSRKEVAHATLPVHSMARGHPARRPSVPVLCNSERRRTYFGGERRAVQYRRRLWLCLLGRSDASGRIHAVRCADCRREIGRAHTAHSTAQSICRRASEERRSSVVVCAPGLFGRSRSPSSSGATPPYNMEA